MPVPESQPATVLQIAVCLNITQTKMPRSCRLFLVPMGYTLSYYTFNEVRLSCLQYHGATHTCIAYAWHVLRKGVDPSRGEGIMDRLTDRGTMQHMLHAHTCLLCAAGYIQTRTVHPLCLRSLSILSRMDRGLVLMTLRLPTSCSNWSRKC